MRIDMKSMVVWYRVLVLWFALNSSNLSNALVLKFRGVVAGPSSGSGTINNQISRTQFGSNFFALTAIINPLAVGVFFEIIVY